jgi:hypothetical protein
VVTAARAGAQTGGPARDTGLTHALEPYGGLSSHDAAALARGGVVVRVLPTNEKDEVALVGVVRADVPRAFFRRNALDTRSALAGHAPGAAGIFHAPATAADMPGPPLEAKDARALRTCRPLHCGIKLPGAAMSSLRDAANVSASSGNAAMREWIVQLVNAYRERGDEALPVYDDTRAGESAARGFAELLAQEVHARETPSLARALTGAPGERVPDVTTTIFWTVERWPGLPAILSVVQRFAYAPSSRPHDAIVAEKLLYADHYLDAMLDVASVVDEAESGTGIAILHVRRMKFDNLPGPGILSPRGRIVRRLHDTFAQSLAAERDALEVAFRTGEVGPAPGGSAVR